MKKLDLINDLTEKLEDFEDVIFHFDIFDDLECSLLKLRLFLEKIRYDSFFINELQKLEKLILFLTFRLDAFDFPEDNDREEVKDLLMLKFKLIEKLREVIQKDLT